MFESMNAEQYRALSNEAFQKRFAEVRDLMAADTLPEGVTDEMLFEEAELIKADMNRRSKRDAFAGLTYEAPKADPAQVEERNAKAQTLIAGEGAVIDSSNKVEQRQSTFKAVSEGKFIESKEYRIALAKHINRTAPMPADYLARIRQERNAGDPVTVSFADGFTNATDPTFSNTVSTPIPIPLTMGELIETRRESGLIYPLVTTTNYKGGVAYPLRDLSIDFHWISDKQVSPYQYDNDATVISFTWHELEARFARTKLIDALMSDNFKGQLAGAIADGYGRIIDDAILNGNGSTQPLGILNDSRVVGAGTSGQSGYVAPAAMIVEASADDLANWSWWVSLLYKPEFNRLYRSDGTWLIGDATFGTYLLTLKDEVNRPLVTFDIRNEENIAKIRGNNLVTLPNNLLGDFDTATTGDVVAIFGNFKNYALNFQPGMPLATTNWEDYETNTLKTRVLTALDGKVLDNNGWVIIKKKASA